MPSKSLFRMIPAWLGFIILPASTFAQTSILSFSTDESCIISKLTAEDHEVTGTDLAGSWSNVLADLTSQLPEAANIDALDYLNEKAVYFSLDSTSRVVDAIYDDEDIIFWNGSAFSMAWDGSANGLPECADIDALHIVNKSPLSFLFSIDGNANLTGVGFVNDEDIVSFNGSIFVDVPFAGSSEGIPRNADLDALAVRSDTEWIMSFDVPLLVDKIFADDADLLVWNPVKASFETSLWFDASGQAIADNVDLNASRASSDPTPTATPTPTPTPTPPPSEDNYEENDSLATGWYPDPERDWADEWLSTIDGIGVSKDMDWYKIFVEDGHKHILVDCRFTHADGNIDIALYTEGGRKQDSLSLTDNEYIDYTAKETNRFYWILVTGDYAGNTYDLWWNDLDPSVTPTPTPSPTPTPTPTSSPTPTPTPTTSPSATATPTPTASPTPPDVNDIVDYLLGLISPTPSEKDAMDTNGDGDVDAADVIFLVLSGG